uniref:Uncharacterized protein n=1 Tax=Arundo donax TaxID=35708 RepID=A0A0A9A7S1_ARUDO
METETMNKKKNIYVSFFFFQPQNLSLSLDNLIIMKYEFLMHAICLYISTTNIYDFDVYLASLHFLSILDFLILVVSFHVSSILI